MVAAPKCYPLLKSHCRDFPMSRTPLPVREADVPQEETGKSTGGEWRGTDPSTYAKIVELTSGWTIFQQGLVATCKDLPTKAKTVGGRRDLVRRMSP